MFLFKFLFNIQAFYLDFLQVLGGQVRDPAGGELVNVRFKITQDHGTDILPEVGDIEADGLLRHQFVLEFLNIIPEVLHDLLEVHGNQPFGPFTHDGIQKYTPDDIFPGCQFTL